MCLFGNIYIFIYKGYNMVNKETQMELDYNKIIDEKAREILDKSSKLYTIASNIIKDETKRDVILQDFFFWMCDHPKKVVESIEKKYFNYLFIRIIKINNSGSNSDYSRRWKVKEQIQTEDTHIIIDEEETKDKIKSKLLIEEIFNNKDKFLINYFEETIFSLYYEKGLSYRKIGSHLGVHFTLVHKRLTQHILPRIKKMYNIQLKK